MAGQHHRTISKRTVDALRAGDRDVLYWDRDLSGFGVRVYASGRKTYVVQCRGPNGSRRVTIGQHGEVTPDEARRQAALAIDRIKRGEPPVPAPPQPEPTVADLAQRFMDAHVTVNCKPSSAVHYRRVLDNHILPALGSVPVGEVDRAQVTALHHKLRSKPVAANRTIDILSKMFSLAEAWELRPAGSNPCRSVRRYREEKRERFLSPDEVRRLGRVLAQAEAQGGASVYAVAAIRLLMLTGCRLNEILSLRWDDVDRTAKEVRIRDGKTGPRSVPLTSTVMDVLAAIPRVPDNPWVIAGHQAGHLPGPYRQALGTPPEPGWLGGREDPRSQTFVRQQGTRARRESHMIGPTAGPHQIIHDGTLRPSGAGHGKGLGSEGGRQHRRAPRSGGRSRRRVSVRSGMRSTEAV